MEKTSIWSWKGRSRRQSYWLLQLKLIGILIAIWAVALILGFLIGGTNSIWVACVLAGILSLPLAYVGFCAQVRRFHDRGLSGWWIIGAGVVSSLIEVSIESIALINPDNMLILKGIGMIVSWSISIAVFVVTVLDSVDDNQYGPNPKRLPQE